MQAEKTLRGNQRAAIDALLRGASVAAASSAAGVNPATLWRWSRDDPAFAKAWRAGSEAALTGAARRLAIATENAAGVLIDVLADSTAPGTAARLRAIDLTLTHAGRLTELVDIIGRLESLEERQ